MFPSLMKLLLAVALLAVAADGQTLAAAKENHHQNAKAAHATTNHKVDAHKEQKADASHKVDTHKEETPDGSIMMTEGVVSETEATKHEHAAANHNKANKHAANKHTSHDKANKHAAAAAESKTTALNVEGPASHHAEAAPENARLAPITLGICAVAAGLVVIMMGAMIAGGRSRKRQSTRTLGLSSTVKTQRPGELPTILPMTDQDRGSLL